MAQVAPDYFTRFANQYVPAMQYAAGVVHGEPYVVSLGAPAAFDADGIDTDIDADAAAGTKTTQEVTATATYGRSVVMQMNADPGNAAVISVVGKDYLGQPMREDFTHSNGSTPIVYGKKAFHFVDYTKIVTAATNAVTCDLGWGYRLGLPFKCAAIAWVKENGVYVPVYKRKVTLTAEFADADATAGRSHFLRSPVPGYIETLRGISHGGGSTNDPVVTVELGGTAVTGLTVTVDTSSAGNVVTDTPTTTGYNANNRVRAGDLIEIVSAAAASAGAITVEVDIVSTQFTGPDVTDPATATTGDTRGTYESDDDFDGTATYELGLFVDRTVNSSGNGGMHGIVQYYA